MIVLAVLLLVVSIMSWNNGSGVEAETYRGLAVIGSLGAVMMFFIGVFQ